MKMKNISTLIAKGIVLISFIYAGAVQPVISTRFLDLANTEVLSGTVQTLGLRFQVAENVYAGFDTDGSENRIYVQQSFGTFGMGTDANGDPMFTIGGHYTIYNNLDIGLDYVINRLTDADGAGVGTDPFADQIRLTLGIVF